MIAIFNHGLTNENNKLNGWNDVSLSDVGRLHVTKCGEHFVKNHLPKRLDVDIYAANNSRSRESAFLLSQCIPFAHLHTSESLKPQWYGSYDGKIFEDIRVRCAIENAKYEPFLFRFNKGEAVADVYERVLIFLLTNNLINDDPNHVNCFHVNHTVSSILRGLILKIYKPNWTEFTHGFLTYYLINGNTCQEVNCHE